MRPAHAVLSDDPNPADDPVARLAALATSFETSLAALTMQIAVEAGGRPNEQDRTNASSTAIRIRAFRQKVRELLGADMMPDSGFDVVLELFSQQVRSNRLGVMDVCAGLEIPPTVTRRWLQKLETAGLLDRNEDLDDHRREWVSLKPETCEAIRLLLSVFPTR